MADITNPFYTEIAASAAAAAGAEGYEVLISHAGLGEETDIDPDPSPGRDPGASRPDEPLDWVGIATEPPTR